MIDKKEMRKSYIEKRNKISKDDILEKSKVIMYSLISTQYYKSCANLFIFMSMGSEVVTEYIIEEAIGAGKTVAIPYAFSSSREMVFIEINYKKLIKSKYGALEPAFDKEKIVKCDKNTVIIVPGNVFDLEGYRIGYGGGYYDTYLEKNISLANIGICFEEQICEKVPLEEHDKKLDMLISEERVISWEI